jgi:predicted DNA-binding transcriptional regulator AlpA
MTLLTQREAAALLHLSERTLERWRVAGDGPKHVRLGHRSIRYRLTEIEAYITSRVVASTSEVMEVRS